MDKKKYAKIFKALSHPNRLEIFIGIAKGSKQDFEGASTLSTCTPNKMDDFKKISEMQDMFATIGASTISHHIKELVNADLITTEKQGKFLVASLNRETWNEVRDFFTNI